MLIKEQLIGCQFGQVWYRGFHTDEHVRSGFSRALVRWKKDRLCIQMRSHHWKCWHYHWD